MERSPLARLPEQRAAILERLKERPNAAPELHARAMTTLASRLKTWWQGPLPPRTRYAASPPRKLPVVLTADPVELLILRAIASGSGSAQFGVTSEGAVFTTVDGMWTADSQAVFVNNLSPLLDQVANVFHHYHLGRMGGCFVEHEGQFETSAWGDPMRFSGTFRTAAIVAEFGRPFAVVRSNELSLLSRARFYAETLPKTRRLVLAREDTPDELVVSFEDEPEWPAKGVLGNLGYRVGINGLSPSDRRKIMRRAFAVELRAASDVEDSHVREWGAPRSAARRTKIEKSLRGFISLARRQKRADKSVAIADWESDLRWMRRTLEFRLAR